MMTEEFYKDMERYRELIGEEDGWKSVYDVALEMIMVLNGSYDASMDVAHKNAEALKIRLKHWEDRRPTCGGGPGFLGHMHNVFSNVTEKAIRIALVIYETRMEGNEKVNRS